MAFDIAYGGYRNEQENMHFVRKMLTKQEVLETSELVKTYQPLPFSTSASDAENKECKLPKNR